MNAENRKRGRELVQLARECSGTEICLVSVEDTQLLDLLDTIDQLEGLLKPLVETEPYPWGVIARCCYCLEEAGHAADCPWYAAKQAIE